MINKIQLGARIRELRQRAHLSQKDLGKVLKCSHAAISDIERGKTDLTVSDLSIIADALKVPITTFLPYTLSIQSQGNVVIQADNDEKDVKIEPSDLHEISAY